MIDENESWISGQLIIFSPLSWIYVERISERIVDFKCASLPLETSLLSSPSLRLCVFFQIF